MTAEHAFGPTLAPDLVERILMRLGFSTRPSADLGGLNSLYAAFSGNVPNDNIQKRIWFAGDQATPVTGGDPIEFFENWLVHGTGGTCFPANGGLCALLRAIGFNANRIAGSVIMEGIEQDANHGSVLVTLEGDDYLADAQFAAFTVLRLAPGQASSTGNGIHDIRAAPVAGGFDVHWFPGPNRQDPLTMRPDLENGPVDHHFFLTHYDLSASRERQRSPFNDVLFISRHFPDSILIIGRNNKIKILADNTVTMTEITDAERTRVLIEELGISEEAAHAIPPDKKGGISPV
jgi:arylamine N-acetyltransferase